MGLIKLPLWWGYLDDRGIIHIQRYTNDRIIQNTEQLPFCKGIFEPFEAMDKPHAQQIILKFLELEKYHQTGKGS